MWIRKTTQFCHIWIRFLSYHLVPERKTIWTTLGSNPARHLRKQARYPIRHRLSGDLSRSWTCPRSSTRPSSPDSGNVGRCLRRWRWRKRRTGGCSTSTAGKKDNSFFWWKLSDCLQQNGTALLDHQFSSLGVQLELIVKPLKSSSL